MINKNLWKKIGSFILDIVEIYTPVVVFILLFCVFMLGIFFRYFRHPLTWTLEFTLMAFIWLVLFGACFAKRKSSHIKFTMIYDKLKTKSKTWMRIVGNALVFIAFSISFLPTYRYIIFMSYKKSTALRVPMSIVYFPYIVFLIIMIARLGYDIITDIKKLKEGSN